MDPAYGATNVTTVVFVGMSVWTIVSRVRGRPDANWPLFFYLGVVMYHQGLPGRLHPYLVFSGVISTLLLRFEFMGGPMLKLMKVVDIGLLALIGYSFATSVFL